MSNTSRTSNTTAPPPQKKNRDGRRAERGVPCLVAGGVVVLISCSRQLLRKTSRNERLFVRLLLRLSGRVVAFLDLTGPWYETKTLRSLRSRAMFVMLPLDAAVEWRLAV